MINNIKIEICIGNIEDAITASKYPIDRIELNSAIELGGLTPSLETIKILKQKINTPLCCMCRCRGGDFTYNELEYETMFNDAENMLKNKADGIVFGFLNKDQTINTEKTKKMVQIIKQYNKEAIFHKAFDEVNDLDESTKTLIELGIDRILTSGKAVYPNIIDGCKVINDLNKKYGDKIQFLPGGGVRIENILEVLKVANTGQVHMTSKKELDSKNLGLDTEQLETILNKIKNNK